MKNLNKIRELIIKQDDELENLINSYLNLSNKSFKKYDNHTFNKEELITKINEEIDKDNLNNARLLLNQNIEFLRDTSTFYDIMGIINLKSNNLENSLICFVEAMKLEINNVNLIYKAAYVNQLLKNYEEAINLYKKCFNNSNNYDFKNKVSKLIMDNYMLIYEECFEKFHKKAYESEVINIGNILYSSDIVKLNYWLFKYEFRDILAPYVMDNIEDYLFLEGPYEYKNITINSDDIVIDCGANMGLFTGVAATKSYNGRIYSFEPVSKTYDILLKTCKLYKNIVSIKKGLSDKDSFLNIDLTGYDENQGSASIMKNIDEYDSNSSYENIEVTTIDNFVLKNNIQKVDFIKADIEGAERLMLKGAINTLKIFAPKLSICTYHLPDDPEVLEKIILDANPNYVIEHRWRKLYAYVPNKS